MMLWSYAVPREGAILTDVIEDPVSVVWTERWDSYGECRIVVPASEAPKVAIGNVLTLEGRRMACEVVSLLIKDGLATVEGRDVLAWLDYRIIDGTIRRDGYVEGFIREMVAPVEQGILPRSLPIIMGPSAGIQATASIQRSWRPMGVVATELARQFGFGIMATRDGNVFRIDLAERTDEGLVLSRETGNLSSERILDDRRRWVTRAIVAPGDFKDGGRVSYHFAAPEDWFALDRREAFVDRRDIPVWLYYPEIETEWGQPVSCAQAGTLSAVSVEEGGTFVIQRIFAAVGMEFQSGTSASATVYSEDFANVLPEMDALVRANFTPTAAGRTTWAMT